MYICLNTLVPYLSAYRIICNFTALGYYDIIPTFRNTTETLKYLIQEAFNFFNYHKNKLLFN